MNPLNPKKLLLTKWTTVKPMAKQKHYLVSRVFSPNCPLTRLNRWKSKRCFLKLFR